MDIKMNTRVKYDNVNMLYKAQHHQITRSVRPLVRAWVRHERTFSVRTCELLVGLEPNLV